MKETWKTITNYPDYKVSNIGRVKRITKKTNTFPGKILKPIIRKNGYLSVILYRREIRIHRLVLQEFLGYPPEDAEADHINHIRSDNRLCNLRWISQKSNRSNQKTKKLLPGEVWLIQHIGSKCSIKTICAMFKISKSTVLRIRSKQGVYRWITRLM